MLARSRRRAREKSFLSQVIRRPNDQKTWWQAVQGRFVEVQAGSMAFALPKQVIDAVPFDRYHPYVGY